MTRRACGPTGVAAATSCWARPRPPAREDRGLDAFFGNFEPYGRLLAHVAAFNDQLQVQDNASWLGLKFSTRGPIKFFAATEWGVNLVRGDRQFNAGATTSSGFLTLDATQNDQVFGARLGYVGVDFGYGGRVTIGKQWGVHTDVTMYTTDQFNVFGSEASATYTAGTDGGFLGTGRADQAVSYRNTIFRVLDVGAQVQFRTTENDNIIDGAGLSAQLTVLPGTRIGAAYTKSYLRRQRDGGRARPRGRRRDRGGGRQAGLEGAPGRLRLRPPAQRRPRPSAVAHAAGRGP